MSLRRRSLLEEKLVQAPPLVAVRVLGHLGRFDESELRLAELDTGKGGDAGAIAREQAVLATARGEYLRALALLEPLLTDPEARRMHAVALESLGRTDEAIAAIAGLTDQASRLLLAEIHIEAGEPQPASVALPSDLSELPRLDAASERLGRARLELARGSIELERAHAPAALPALRSARNLAGEAGAVSLLARAWSRLGEAHARCANRWRALRAVTHGLDLARTGQVAARHIAGIHYRAWLVYGVFGHINLAEQAAQSGHHRLIQIATQIDVREYRESFLLDQRDNRRLIAAWKGEENWGADIPRGSAS